MEASMMTSLSSQNCRRNSLLSLAIVLAAVNAVAATEDILPYEPPIVSLATNLAAVAGSLQAIVRMPAGESRTSTVSAANCIVTRVESSGATNTLCIIFDQAGTQADIFTTNGQYIVTVGAE